MKKIINTFFNLKLKIQLIILMLSTTAFLFFIQVSYFSLSYKAMRQNAIIYADALTEQINQSIDLRIYNLILSTQAVASNTNVQEFLVSKAPAHRYRYVKFIQSFIDYIISSNDEILDLALLDQNNQLLFARNSLIYDVLDALAGRHSDYFGEAYNDPFFDVVTLDTGRTYFVYVQPIAPSFYPERVASCISIYANSSIQEILNNARLTNSTLLYLYNEDNIIVASNNYDTLNTELPDILLTASDSTSIRHHGQNYIIRTQTLASTGWHLAFMIPENEVFGNISRYIIFGIIITAITLLILAFLFVLLWRNITSPIHALSVQLEAPGSINRHQRIQINEGTGNEIMHIGVSINKMLTQLENLNHEIFQTQAALYETELTKKEAELFALQTQINPHFLYNTLDCIRDISLVYGVDEIGAISISMAQMFRYCIARDRLVTIREELECVQNYINIIQIRYMNRFTIELEVPEELYEEKILKFILQPLIENSFYHGLERKSGPSFFSLTGKRNADGTIGFVIYDTGIGIPKDQLSQLNVCLQNGTKPDPNGKHTGAGLFNIYSRLRMQYGAPYGIALESQEGEWTRVTMTLPSGIK